MKVLVATNETQGLLDDDYSWTVEGELVYVQSISCPDRLCGCTRGFAGMSSSRATTTAMVVDRPEITVDDLGQALTDSLDRGGWLKYCDEAESTAMVGELLNLLVNITEPAEEGSIVRRDGDIAFVK